MFPLFQFTGVLVYCEDVPVNEEETEPVVVPLTLTVPAVPVNEGVTLNSVPENEPEIATFVPVNVGVAANAAVALVIALPEEVLTLNVNVSLAKDAFKDEPVRNELVEGVTVTFGLDTEPAGV